jgi:hypothetical protein
MPSPIAKRIEEQRKREIEQQTEREIEEDNQRLRDKRGNPRSPGQDYITEEDETNTNERRVKNTMNAVNNIELTENLDYHISEAINSAVIDYSEDIENLGDIFPSTPITRDVIGLIREGAESNTYTFMFDIMPILLNDDDTIGIIGEDYLLSLTYNIFIFSLYDIVYGYQHSAIVKDFNYRKMIKSMVEDRIDTLRKEELFIESKMVLFYNRINKLVVKNINDGISIKIKGDRKKVEIIDGGKTKKRRYVRNSKNVLRVKGKKQETKRRRRFRKKI